MPVKPVDSPFAVDFFPAVGQGPARNGQRIDVVVIHDMEAPEKPHVARAVAKWFAGLDAPRASAHYCVDDGEVIQCVREFMVAWGAPGANRNGIHIELAGYANQTPEGWLDDYGKAMMSRLVELVFEICFRHDIPLQKLSPEDVKNGHRGICGHADVSRAFPEKAGEHPHWDPGPNFPWDEFLRVLRAGMRDTLPDRGDDPNA